MDKALNALFQFDEGAVIRETHHPTGDMGAHRITFGCMGPGIFTELFHPQRDTFFFQVEIEVF